MALAAILILASPFPGPAQGWETLLPQTRYDTFVVRGLGVDAAGDIYVTATASSPGTDLESEFLVASFDGESGVPKWTKAIPALGGGTGTDARGLKIDPSGDVVVIGRSSGRGMAAKLSGSAGELIWLATFDVGAPMQVELDAFGDVFVLAFAYPAASLHKLSGSDGSTLWTYGDARSSFFSAGHTFAVDGTGDVLTPVSKGVAKLAGDCGTERWRATDAYVERVAVGPAGGVFTYEVRASTDPSGWRSRVTRRHEADGGVEWERDIGVGLNALVPGPAGQLYLVIASSEAASGLARFEVAIVDSSTGMVRRRRAFDSADRRTWFNDIATDERGDIVVLYHALTGGWLTKMSPGADATKMRPEVWTALLSPGTFGRVALDGHGDVILAGDHYSSDGVGVFVAKRSGLTGARRDAGGEDGVPLGARGRGTTHSVISDEASLLARRVICAPESCDRPVCDDGDPCTVDVATARGCRWIRPRGVGGALCRLPGERPSACHEVPAPVARGAIRARRLLEKAARAGETPRVNLLTRRTLRVLDRAVRAVRRAQRQDRLATSCADALAAEIGAARRLLRDAGQR